ncbi:helix-turn-helix domain-containing protein [Pediococcus pentosaceus]|uniref:helix-turn-helix domain-containing protein n=1 Tax=Pediococcus pentosaceus TaxID=1255 RepID=UPI00223B0019|nr:helix-turn-helix transcriptional regulator [Pediococcus pentosaceus]MCT1176148.1 XRE family transcriptional regulator [Pediococcus pentosaceus]
MNDDAQASQGVLKHLKAKQIKQEDVANYLGISRTTLNRKLNGLNEFKISEIKLIHKQYNVPLSLFFEE